MPCRAAVPYHLDISKEGMSPFDTSHITFLFPSPLIDDGPALLRDGSPRYVFYSIQPHAAYLREPLGQENREPGLVYGFIR